MTCQESGCCSSPLALSTLLSSSCQPLCLRPKNSCLNEDLSLLSRVVLTHATSSTVTQSLGILSRALPALVRPRTTELIHVPSSLALLNHPILSHVR